MLEAGKEEEREGGAHFPQFFVFPKFDSKEPLRPQAARGCSRGGGRGGDPQKLYPKIFVPTEFFRRGQDVLEEAEEGSPPTKNTGCEAPNCVALRAL